MGELLTRKQCNAARALAIAGVVLHNYCHAFDFAIKESEFAFNLAESMRWGDYLCHIDENLLINIFSWGVSFFLPAFMFLCGYGLVLKYEKNSSQFTPLSFIVKQYRKLLALVLVPFVAFIVLQYVGLRHTFVTPWAFLAQLGMVINFFPTLKIVPNPYWYLGMTMQLYLIYAIIHRFRGKRARLWIPVLLIAIGFALHVFVPGESDFAGWMRYNAPVALIPFGLGLLAARFCSKNHLTVRRAAVLLPVLVMVYVAFNFNYVLWGLCYGVSAIAIMCFAVLLRGRVLAWAVKVGEVSALIYILHPVVRFAVMLPAMRYIPQWTHTQIFVYLLLTAAAVWIYRRLKIDEKVNKYIGAK